jgi:flavin-dependent dehydrogenase
MKKYDLVVVGAGPAGLMAAKVAAENGLRVALVERKKLLPKIVRPCAEGFFAHRWSHGEYVKVNYRDSRFCFPAHGFSVKYEGPLKDLHRFINYSPDGHRMEVAFSLQDESGKTLSQHISFEKESLLNGLLEEAVENHVDIYPGVNVTKAEKTEDGVKVSGNDHDLWGVFVIGADGIHSRLAREFGLNKGRQFYGTLSAMVWRMKKLEPAHKDAHIHVAGGKGVPPLFCICPQAQEDEYLVTVGSYHRDDDYEKRLREIMRQGTFSPWFKKAEIMSRQALVMSLLSPIGEPFSQNCLLIGDACAFAQISNHHALLCGWKAANAVTVALIDHKYDREGVSGYLEWWKQNFYETHRTPRADVFESLEGEEINYLFSLFREPVPAARDDKGAAKNISEAMAGIMPVVKKERPDLFDRLSSYMAKPPDDTWEEHRKAGIAPK